MAGTAPDPARHLVVVGVNRRSSSPALRERLFAREPDLEALLAELGASGLTESVAIATCERVELFALDEDPETAQARLQALLARNLGLEPAELSAEGFSNVGEAALRHLFAVVASLDSQIVGEPQILGQVKDCHRRAARAGLVGPALDGLFQAAFGVAKRVRSETAIGRQSVSIATAALQLARDVLGDLGHRRALLAGLGEMGEFMAGELMHAGVADLVVLHESLERAEAAAQRLGCHFRPWDELEQALAAADIVVAAAGTGRYRIAPGPVEAALRRRRREPIFLIDAALPGDIDPAVAVLDGAFVYDLADLERVALSGKAAREATLGAAEAILERELAAFLRARAERDAAPTVAALRRHFEAARDGVLDDGALSAEDSTQRLVNRLLHDPFEVLRQAAARRAERGETAEEPLEAALRRLFRLDATAPDEMGAGDLEDD